LRTRPGRDSGTATDPSAKPSRPAIPPETRLFPSLRVYLCSAQRMPNQACSVRSNQADPEQCRFPPRSDEHGLASAGMVRIGETVCKEGREALKEPGDRDWAMGARVRAREGREKRGRREREDRQLFDFPFGLVRKESRSTFPRTTSRQCRVIDDRESVCVDERV
jgi:hypothetical protein